MPLIPIYIAQTSDITANGYRAGYDPYKACDGTDATGWASTTVGSGATQDCWLKIDLKGVKSISKILISIKHRSQTLIQHTLGIQYSNDNSSWSTLIETKQFTSGGEAILSLEFKTSITGRYLKIYNPNKEAWAVHSGDYTGEVQLLTVQAYGE